MTNEWLPAVKLAIDRFRSPSTSTGIEDIDIHRKLMIKYAHKMFSWKMSANILIEKFNMK